MSPINQERVPGSSLPKDQEILRSWHLTDLDSKGLASRIAFVGVVLGFLVIAILATIHASKWVGNPFPGFLVTPRIGVANIGQYYWTGITAGLKYPDRIVKANGADLHSIEEFKKIVRETKVGDPINFAVERNGKIFEVAVPTMSFGWTDLLATFGLELLAALAYVIIGIVVFVLKPDTAVSWSFLLLCTFLSLYNVTDFDKGATGFARIYMLAMTFVPAAGLHLSWLFPERRKFLDRLPVLHYIPYLISLALFVPLLSIYPQPGFRIFYQLSLLFFLVAAITVVFSTLYSFIKSPSRLAKQRGKVVLFGAALAFPLPAVIHYISLFEVTATNLAVASNFLPIPIVVFPASIAYAIAKHNLFDVDVYIKRAVGYALMTVVVGTGYLSVQTVTNKFILRPLFGELADEVYSVLFSLLVVFFFNPVNQKVQSTVDRLFFRSRLNYKDTVQRLTNALASLLNFEEILARVVQTLKKEMFIDTVGLFVMQPEIAECRNFFDSDEAMIADSGRREIAIRRDDPLIALIVSEKKLITKYDIAEDPRYADVRESCAASFGKVGASLALPLIYQGEVTGVLTLGQKKSGHFYSRDDIELLDTLANEAAVSIENARLAEQMKKEEGVRANLSRYLSPQIVDQIVKNNVEVNLGGDKKVVTVLFSDIRNFTTITESRKPDELAEQLNEYFTEMAGIIFENGGSLDKYIGDAIVAVFGSLIDLENAAESAARAALKMMQRLPELNERWVAKYGLKMEFGIGLSTGEVFLGNIGSPERMEFTVIGDTVNVASRFSGLAKAGQVIMTRETLNCLGKDVEYKEHPPAQVKGKTGLLEVFELVRI